MAAHQLTQTREKNSKVLFLRGFSKFGASTLQQFVRVDTSKTRSHPAASVTQIQHHPFVIVSEIRGKYIFLSWFYRIAWIFGGVRDKNF